MVKLAKNIWLVNYYAMPPHLESRLRTIKFAQYLGQKGYNVTIFSSSFLHNTNKNIIKDSSKYIYKKYNGLNFVHIKTTPYKSNGLKRFISLFLFHYKLFIYKKKFLKPEVIIHTALPPFGNILYFAARKLNAKYIVEVLDLWPQSFVDFGLIGKKNPLLSLLYFSEKWLYKKSDNVVFSMEGGKDYIIDKKWDLQYHGESIDLNKLYYINNGVDLTDFNLNKQRYKLSDPDLEDTCTKKVIYIGSIRLANNLKELVQAAEILKNREDIKFLLYGDGDARDNLEIYCKEQEINNVIFKEKWIEPKYVPYVISQANVNILNYIKGFGRYGGSQSKLFQYLASGNPICSNINMRYCPINNNHLGISKEFKSAKEYADAIERLVDLDPQSISEIRKQALNIVRKYDYCFLTEQLESLL